MFDQISSKTLLPNFALYFGFNIFEKRLILFNLNVLQMLQVANLRCEHNANFCSAVDVARLNLLQNSLSSIHTAYNFHSTDIHDILIHFSITTQAVIEFSRDEIKKILEYRDTEREMIFEKYSSCDPNDCCYDTNLSTIGNQSPENLGIENTRRNSLETKTDSSDGNRKFSDKSEEMMTLSLLELDEKLMEYMKAHLSLIKAIFSSELYSKTNNIPKLKESEINGIIKKYLASSVCEFTFLTDAGYRSANTSESQTSSQPVNSGLSRPNARTSVTSSLSVSSKNYLPTFKELLEKVENSVQFFMTNDIGFHLRQHYRLDIKEICRQEFHKFIQEKCQSIIANFDPEINKNDVKILFEYLVDFNLNNFNKNFMDSCRILFLENDLIRNSWLDNVQEVLYLLEPGCEYSDFINKLDFICLMFKSYWLAGLKRTVLKEILTSFLQNITDLCILFQQYNYWKGVMRDVRKVSENLSKNKLAHISLLFPKQRYHKFSLFISVSF